MSAEPLSDGLECPLQSEGSQLRVRGDCKQRRESLGRLHLAQFSQRQKEYPGIGSTSLGFVSVRQEKIDLLLADLHPRRQWQQQAKRVHILGPHLCRLCSAVLSIIFTAACHILSHVLSTLPVIWCRSSSTISPLSQLKRNGMQIDLVRAADDSQMWSEKVESMICVVVSSIGEDKEELMDLLKAHPNLVAWSQNVFGSTVPGMVCIR